LGQTRLAQQSQSCGGGAGKPRSASAYHEFHGEQQGGESRPTLYWRDRRKDGLTYHIDYVFLPDPWIRKVKELRLGRFEDWCGAGLSDHVPVIVDVGL
jgi:exodeoxyribonuclease-3